MEKFQYPILRKLSEKTSVRLCFKDGHIEVLAKVPLWPKPVALRIDAEDIPQALEVLQNADGWCKMPLEQRERLSAE